MIYEYRNNAGETREIHARMSDPPPEWVSFNQDGHWSPAVANDPLAFRRVYGDVTINRQTVTGKYGYFSRTLPVNIPGEQHNKLGQTFVRDKHHARELCKKTGYEQFD